MSKVLFNFSNLLDDFVSLASLLRQHFEQISMNFSVKNDGKLWSFIEDEFEG